MHAPRPPQASFHLEHHAYLATEIFSSTTYGIHCSANGLSCGAAVLMSHTCTAFACCVCTSYVFFFPSVLFFLQCGKGGEWQRCMSLMNQMRSEGIVPNVYCFSSLINACGKVRSEDKRDMHRIFACCVRPFQLVCGLFAVRQKTLVSFWLGKLAIYQWASRLCHSCLQRTSDEFILLALLATAVHE